MNRLKAIMNLNSRRIAAVCIIAALGVILSPIFIPVGPIKLYPIQSALNVIAGILLGPFWAVTQAFIVSTIRNILGVGTIFAYPGSLIGSFLVGMIYWYFYPNMKPKHEYIAGFGEFIGTGLIGGTIAALVFAPLFFPRQAEILGAMFFFISFCANTIGFPIGNFIVVRLRKIGVTYKTFLRITTVK